MKKSGSAILFALLFVCVFTAAFNVKSAHAQPNPTYFAMGITGCKLVFNETMDPDDGSGNPLNSYYWTWYITATWQEPRATSWTTVSYTGDDENAGYSLSSIPSSSFNLLGTCVLPSAVLSWDLWLKIQIEFTWTYNGSPPQNVQSTRVYELNVHPGDIAGASVTLPYLGANGVCNLSDLGLVTGNWQAHVPQGTDPTSNLARADINGNGIINLSDLGLITGNWQKNWTNTPPS